MQGEIFSDGHMMQDGVECSLHNTAKRLNKSSNSRSKGSRGVAEADSTAARTQVTALEELQSLESHGLRVSWPRGSKRTTPEAVSIVSHDTESRDAFALTYPQRDT